MRRCWLLCAAAAAAPSDGAGDAACPDGQDAALRALCPSPSYKISAARRYDWNSRAPPELEDPSFDFGPDVSMLEIGGPTPHGDVYSFVARADNVAQRNHFDAMHQWGAYPSEGDFDGLPYAPRGATLGTTFQRHAAQLIGIDDASYDLVMASHVLEHMLDPLAALREWDRVLRPGGRLLMLLPWAPAVEYDSVRDPATMQELLHLSARNASFDEAVLRRHAELLLRLWAGDDDRARLFSLCPPGTARGDAACRVDENVGHWHVWDFDLLREAVGGCLGYNLEVMSLQEPHHQVVLARKPVVR